MPYPESCPECGGAFRNTGTHYTARRNEVGRHVLLELGCQNTSRRYWWDFTSGSATDDSATPAHQSTLAASSNGHIATLATLEPAPVATPNGHHLEMETTMLTTPEPESPTDEAIQPVEAPRSLKDAFVRQLQLDRLTLRQMRSWLMSDEARRAMEVAAGATEATY